MVWFATPWVGVVVGLRGFLGSEWVSGFSLGCRVFLLLLRISLDFFSSVFLGAQGFWAVGLALDWVSMVEFEM